MNEKPFDLKKMTTDLIIERLNEKESELRQREKSDAELLIQDYIREFDELYMRNPVEVRGKRFVEIENRMMEINDFLNYRLGFEK